MCLLNKIIWSLGIWRLGKNLTILGHSDFTLIPHAMSYLGFLFLTFSAVLDLLPEPMTMGFKRLWGLKTKAIFLLLASLFLPF